MPDDRLPPEALRLDPPIGVPEPAPLDMPRRRLRRFPLDVGRLLPRPSVTVREPQGSESG